MSSSYPQLTYEPSGAARLDYWIRKSLGFLVCRVWPFGTLLRWIERGALAVRNCATNYELLIPAVTQKDAAQAQQFGSGFGYDDEVKELETVIYYRDQVKNPGFARLSSESPALYDCVLRVMDGLIKADPSVARVLDFGLAYAHVDSMLARRFPEVEFMGIDRSQLTVAVNAREFEGLQNLKLHAGDVFQFLGGLDRLDVLFHMRTACLLPADFLKRLYGQARERGARYVVLAEQVGLSWQTGKGYEFSDQEKPSELLRWRMWIHNYPALLAQAGFQVSHAELIATGHRDKNLRILVIVAHA